MRTIENDVHSILLFLSGGGGTGGGDASATNQLLQLTELEEINTKTPALIAGKIPVDGSNVIQPISPPYSNTCIISSVNATTSNTVILPSIAGVNRKGASFYLDSTDSCYLLFSTNIASSSNYSVKLLPNSYYELPYNYVGNINGIFTGTNGSLKVTEFR